MASYEQARLFLRKAIETYKTEGGSEESQTLMEAACGLFAHTLVIAMGTLGDPTPEERAELEAMSVELEKIHDEINARKNKTTGAN